MIFVTAWVKCVLQRDPYSEYHPSSPSLVRVFRRVICFIAAGRIPTKLVKQGM